MTATAPPAARIHLGGVEVTRIPAAVYRWDGGNFFGVVPKTMWSRKVPADGLNRIEVAWNCYLIRTAGHSILVETGGGDKLDAHALARMDLPPHPEPLRDIMRRHDCDPDAVDIVINSHLHWDHCGGNTILSPEGPTAAFPQARYFASGGEWEHAHERLERDGVAYNDDNYDPLVKSGQMMLVDGDYEVIPGVWMRHAPGHNRDMMVITAQDGGATFCFLSDLVPMAAHLKPTWVTAFDLFPLETIANKLRWLGDAAEHQWVCGFGHDVDMAFARIIPDPKTRFSAEPVNPVR